MPMRHVLGPLSFLIFSFLAACGTVASQTNSAPPPSGGEAPPSASYSDDPNVPHGNTAVVLGANFTDPTGTLSLLPINAPRTAVKNLQTTHSDAMVRSYGGLLYVVNRLGGDNIEVVDPSDFHVVSQFTVGEGTNPQDLIAVSATKAYVSLYEPENNRTDGLEVDDLIVIDPETGEIAKTIDLTPFTANDGDRFARVSDLVKVGSRIFAAVQDLGSDLSLAADQPGKIVAVDTATDSVIDSMVLAGHDPVALAYSSETGLLYVACADYFNLGTSYGGVEIVDPSTLTSLGIFVTDNDLGGAPGDIEVSDGRGFLTVGTSNAGKDIYSTSVVSFNLDPAASPDVETLYEGAAYIQDIAVDENGLLLVGDRDPRVNGVLFLDPTDGAVIAGPVNTGPLVSSIAFIER
jgi:DNA-binding beta-propeller fold protein YncE